MIDDFQEKVDAFAILSLNMPRGDGWEWAISPLGGLILTSDCGMRGEAKWGYDIQTNRPREMLAYFEDRFPGEVEEVINIDYVGDYGLMAKGWVLIESREELVAVVNYITLKIRKGIYGAKKNNP